MKEKLTEVLRKRRELEAKLVGPARAAANQMKDAGMTRESDPLLEIIFQLDAVDSEAAQLMKSEEGINALLELITGKAK